MKKSLLAGIAALILLTAVFAAIHLTTRTPESEGSILVNGETVTVSSLEMSPVFGTTVNGRGEDKPITARGIALTYLCPAEFDAVTVTALDEYRVEIKADEIQNAYLIISDDDSVQLIVFGDADSKRNVKDVVRIDIR